MSIQAFEMEVPTFYPSVDEFLNFSQYVSKIESCGAHRIGLAKIVPPKPWTARRMGYRQKQIEQTLVHNPIKQEIHGNDGLYSVTNIQQRTMNMSQFQRLAASDRYTTPPAIANSVEKLEKKYWEKLTTLSPIYGADVSGTFYDKNQTVWNVNHLGTILDDLHSDYGTKIEGVNTTYLYFGMWKATFAWHTEDMDLYSINYLHFGAPKQWYVIPPSYGKRFEKLAATHFPALARRCPAFLRHKMTIIAPSILKSHAIPVSKITQYEGEFIITFPYAYHAGFNYGFNCAESTNFATARWIEYGKHSVQCACRHDMVKIEMDRFVLRYQPELYNDWRRGMNLSTHPEDEPMSVNHQRTIVRSSPTKKPLPVSLMATKSSTAQTLQYRHHEQISRERYACIFRSLAEFDREQLPSDGSIPLIRAALTRARFKLENDQQGNTRQLLCLAASGAWRLPSLLLASFPHTFLGLEQSGQYRQTSLHNLWNYQSVNTSVEQKFNLWLSTHRSPCAICYLFTANKNDHEPFSSVQSLVFLLTGETTSKSTDTLTCTRCQTSVHRECYDNVCSALNVEISNPFNPWLCQRCTSQERASCPALDDRCSACLLRGGLLLRPNFSTAFIHALCAIAQAYPSPSLVAHPVPSCHYCQSFCPLNYRRVSTHYFLSCHQSTCPNQFHVTCGLLSGCTIQLDYDQSIISARCHRHALATHPPPMSVQQEPAAVDKFDDETSECPDQVVDDERENDDEIVAENERVPMGTRVILKDGTLGRVLTNEISFHYAVDFGDGSYSHDMLAEDILDFDPSLEPFLLQVGSTIRIRWTDGKTYACKYLSRRRVLLYHIEVDKETRQMHRNEFSYDVQLPSPPLTPSQTEQEHNYSRRQPVSKRKQEQQHRRAKTNSKRRRRRPPPPAAAPPSSIDES